MKRKKYNIITFSLLAFFFLFGFLSKHLKEPVNPAAKTHHISHSLSSKSSSSHKKEKTKSSTTTSKEDKKKDQASPSVQAPNQKQNNQTSHQDGNQEKSKPAEGGRGWGGPEDGSYAINGGGGGGHDAAFAAGAGGGSNHASSTHQSNEWVDDVDNNPYEYPQASSSTDTSANSN